MKDGVGARVGAKFKRGYWCSYVLIKACIMCVVERRCRVVFGLIYSIQRVRRKNRRPSQWSWINSFWYRISWAVAYNIRVLLWVDAPWYMRLNGYDTLVNGEGQKPHNWKLALVGQQTYGKTAHERCATGRRWSQYCSESRQDLRSLHFVLFTLSILFILCIHFGFSTPVFSTGFSHFTSA